MDYRSDTVTRPTAGMLQAMIEAKTGDDVFGEDPTVNALEKRMSEMFGMEAALFCPSGTMTNQIAVKGHTQPGDEAICSDLAHVYVYEGGGMAANSGVQPRLIPGNMGRFSARQVEQAINPPDLHRPVTKLVCLENTVNRGGGCCYDFKEIRAIREVCDKHDLKLHLDGGRLFNALVAKGETPKQYGGVFDSISVCLSKGLGCPVGSVLLGSKDFIFRCRRIRKRLGGGMRQAGILAAAGLYALDHHIERLSEDHSHALQIAKVLHQKEFVDKILPVETNILIFEVKGRFTAASFSQKLKELGILALPVSHTGIRMVLHLDITPKMVEKTCEALKRL